MGDQARASQAEAQRRAHRLQRRAQEEARQARRHRRRAKRLFEQADEILRAHAKSGMPGSVRIEFGDQSPSPQGGPSGNTDEEQTNPQS